MKRSYLLLPLLLLSGLAVMTLGVPARTQQPPSQPVRLEAVAETRLLMEGIAHPNFKGLERTLKKKPATVEEWTFARGQALLIAETGNLLLLRPPRNQGRDAWLQQAQELRQCGTALARLTAKQDLEGSRKALVTVSTACNRCHQTFQVSVRLIPFAEPAKP